MSSEVRTIGLGGVNCYLAKCKNGFILIDTGIASKRALLVEKLEEAGCLPGNLKLILITHGDIDHADNAAYLRGRFGAKIGMHPDDFAMVELGNMGANRKARPDKMSGVFRMMTFVFRVIGSVRKIETFKPDFAVDEEFDLSAYGFNAKVVHIPGHSKGSIGILTDDGNFYCGDLMYNMLGFKYVDDLADHTASMRKLSGLNVKMIYPGHGKPMLAGTRLSAGRE